MVSSDLVIIHPSMEQSMEFAVSIKTKTPVMERFALYEDYPSLSSRAMRKPCLRGISLRVIFV